jgi:hypothetical protein
LRSHGVVRTSRSGEARFSLLVPSDFLWQHFPMLLQALHLLFHVVLMAFKQERALYGCLRTLAAQSGKVDHLCERHACLP